MDLDGDQSFLLFWHLNILGFKRAKLNLQLIHETYVDWVHMGN
jgi:hypothetical protein